MLASSGSAEIQALIDRDPEPAYQLRRYAWSAKLPISILTDFEDFAVYDCRIRPEKTDRAATARLMQAGGEGFPPFAPPFLKAGKLVIGHRANADTGPSPSTGSPTQFSTRPVTPGPTGTLIGAWVS